MSLLATAVFAALATVGATSAPAHAAGAPQDATLSFGSSNSVLAGISFGMNAVDGRSLLLDQRTSTRLAAGRRTIWYSCPNSLGSQGGAITFDFAPDTRYVLSCGGGLGAQIRVAEGC